MTMRRGALEFMSQRVQVIQLRGGAPGWMHKKKYIHAHSIQNAQLSVHSLMHPSITQTFNPYIPYPSPPPPPTPTAQASGNTTTPPHISKPLPCHPPSKPTTNHRKPTHRRTPPRNGIPPRLRREPLPSTPNRAPLHHIRNPPLPHPYNQGFNHPNGALPAANNVSFTKLTTRVAVGVLTLVPSSTTTPPSHTVRNRNP